MGRIVDGQWVTEALITSAKDGAFKRADAVYRNWITCDGSVGPTGVGGYAAASGRYHLYVSYACPWAHRTLIFRALKGLTDHVSVDVVHPDMLDQGWTFDTDYAGATGDRLFGSDKLHQIYTRADSNASGRATVPVLWDKETGTIVSNESSEIIRMFNSAFDDLTGNRLDFYPESLRTEIDAVNHRIYNTLNNGVYRCGFAVSQQAYDVAVNELFDTMDWLEDRLTGQRYLAGDHVTEADWRLFPTLARFDGVYHGHFKCSRNRLIDFPSLWGYARELYQMPGVAETVNIDHIRRHYHYSHESINPTRIVPLAPQIDWLKPHGRGAQTDP